ncbi:lpg1639 family Dot/Icm T4SS effector [Fundidesulfovibrio butyratiphilus]
MFQRNDDNTLLAKVKSVRETRRAAGLEGLTGDLEALVVRTQPEAFEAAVAELLGNTGHGLRRRCVGPHGEQAELALDGSADIVVRAHAPGAWNNPFRQANTGAKSGAKPDTRLETFVFSCRDVEAYYDIQRRRGVPFLGGVERTESCLFVRTAPSPFTGNSLGFVQWLGAKRDFTPDGAGQVEPGLAKPDRPHLADIGRIDHVAARVRAEERDQAILEFMALTGYDFSFAVYVESLNSITNVARLSPEAYAQVFTSGIAPFDTPETSGPTELFIHNYGARSHHVAFETANIERTVEALRRHGQGFLLDLAGSREEGLKQVFTRMSPNSWLVNEYIQRYDGFDGFFTKSNVTVLTEATRRQ